MNIDLNKLASISAKVRTPLGLSGLIIVVLYGIYRQVLSLNIFSKVGENATVVLIGGILNKLFWLAMTTLILGIGSHVLVLVLRAKAHRRARVELVDQHVVDSNSDQKAGANDQNRQNH